MRRTRPWIGLAREIDDRLSEAGQVVLLESYRGKWIKTARVALGWVAADLARKLGVSQQSISQLEKREAEGKLSIRKLEAVAEALDCKLVYGFVPNKSMAAMATELDERQRAARRMHKRMPRPA